MQLTTRIQIFTDYEKDHLAFEMVFDVPSHKIMDLKNKLKSLAEDYSPLINISNLLDKYKETI